MVDQELINNIKTRFQQGEKASEIRDALFNEGWSDGDIDAAFSQIRHEAYMQIPFYAKMHSWMQSVDQKTATLPTRVVVQIFIAIAILFIGGVFLLYYLLDPLGMRSAERDKQREEASIELRLALEKYYKANNSSFPTSLDKLVPNYLKAVPLDPRSKTPYTYKTFSQNLHYEFCIDFETQIVRCISSDQSSSIPDAPQDGSVTPPAIKQYAINGQVFFDSDKDGGKSDDEKTSPGVAIRIADGQGTVACDITTDSSGIFNCNVTGEGQYSVTITPPVGYTSEVGNVLPVSLPTTTATPTIETLFIGLVK